MPSSRTERTSAPSADSSTTQRDAPACLVLFETASWVMRYATDLDRGGKVGYRTGHDDAHVGPPAGKPCDDGRVVSQRPLQPELVERRWSQVAG